MDLFACKWCTDTHVADVLCICKVPCRAGWCPAGAAADMAAEVMGTQSPA